MKKTLRLLLALSLCAAARAETLKINGSTTVNLPVAEAAEILRAGQKMDIQVDTQGGSAGGISMLGDGLVQVGMASKHLNEDDLAKYPNVVFREIQIGEDAVALIVSKDVWDGGVKALTKQQIKDIYEGRVTNWKDVGGKPQRIRRAASPTGWPAFACATEWAKSSRAHAATPSSATHNVARLWTTWLTPPDRLTPVGFTLPRRGGVFLEDVHGVR